MTTTLDLSAASGHAAFRALAARDLGDAHADDPRTRWLLVDHDAADEVGGTPGITGYDGPRHLRRWFDWAAPFDFPDTFLGDDHPLVATSAMRDAACLDALGVDRDGVDLRHVGRYNAQDQVLARERLPAPPRVVLDLGPGHGRLANLALAPGTGTSLVVAVEGIVGPYLTQRAYYAGLGLRVADPLDDPDLDVPLVLDAGTHDVLHLPTWRLDRLPDASVDLVCAVQVLKELPPATVRFVLSQLQRVVRPCGRLYVRDHLDGHDLTGLPTDALVAQHGFTSLPGRQVRDRVDLHGVPRLWERTDASYGPATDAEGR